MLKFIDSEVDRRERITTFVRIYVTPTSGHKVRVTVKRDPYQFQSYAKVEVLTPALTWTELTTSSPRVWWESANIASIKDAPEGIWNEIDYLENVAEDLVFRADKILS